MDGGSTLKPPIRTAPSKMGTDPVQRKLLSEPGKFGKLPLSQAASRWRIDPGKQRQLAGPAQCAAAR